MPWLQTGSQALNMLGGVYGFTPTTFNPNMAATTPLPGSSSSGSNRTGSGILGLGNSGPLSMQNDGIKGNYNAWVAAGRPQNYDPTTGLAIQPAQPQTAQPSGGYLQNAPNYDNFFKSPDYNFRLSEGIKGLDRSAAARGRLYSGGYGQDLTDYGQGLAASEYGNWFNRLSALAGTGQASAQNVGAAGQNAAGQIGNAYQNAGNARASGYANSSNAWANAANNVAGIVGYGAQTNWGR